MMDCLKGLYKKFVITEEMPFIHICVYFLTNFQPKLSFCKLYDNLNLTFNVTEDVLNFLTF